jgi:hypothetical protein
MKSAKVVLTLPFGLLVVHGAMRRTGNRNTALLVALA